MRKSFTKSDDGVVAVLFGIAVLPAMVLAGGTLDYSMASSTKTKLQGIADSAALATAQDAFVRDREEPAVAREFVTGNLSEVSANFLDAAPDVTVTFGEEEVTVVLEADVENAFLGLIGMPTTPISVTSTASIGTDDVEIVMALDMTGSMKGEKVRLMRDAAQSFSEQLFDATVGRQELSIGGVPWNVVVNVGDRKSWLAGYDADDFAASDPWNGCVMVRDAQFGRHRPPSSARFEPFNVADFATGKTNADICHASPVLALTDDARAVDLWLDGLRSPDGATISSLGMAWAYNAISPDWSSAWGKRIAKWGEARKYVVLLSDGANNLKVNNDGTYKPTAYGEFLDIFPEGLRGKEFDKAVDKHTLEICDDLKSRDVTIFTIQFAVKARDKAAAEAMLRPCASDEDAYIKIDEVGDIDQAFDKIRKRISTPRLMH